MLNGGSVKGRSESSLCGLSKSVRPNLRKKASEISSADSWNSSFHSCSVVYFSSLQIAK